ncbi:hypothetical protein F5Y14DRAFT_412790 [Nemania sp. NC0429]|nr:hypothetical protein F5Y14DRAFT_412790 [Nemania sp. NC0429]
MSTSNIHFISIAGPDSADDKKDRQRRVRSLVASRHYRQQRAENIEANLSYEQSTRVVVRNKNNQPQSKKEIQAPSAAPGPHGRTRTRSSPNAWPTVRLRQQITAEPPAVPEASGDESRHFAVSRHHMSYLGQGAKDPFVAMPTSVKTPRMDRHLNYYVNVLMRQMRPSWTFALVRKKFGCRSFVNADELQLMATCVFASTARAMRTGDLAIYSATDELGAANLRSASFDWLYFKGKTMQIINARLAVPQHAISDHTIGAICELILSETYSGNTDHIAIHALGLRQLEELRRSNDDLPHHLTYRILESYIKAATVSLTKLAVPFTLKMSKSGPLAHIEHVLPDLGSYLIRKWPQLSSNQAVVSILHDIVTTTRHTYGGLENGTRGVDEDYHDSIAYMNLYIEYRLLNWDASTAIERICRIACLLYVNTSLVRAYQPSAAIIRNLVTALREMLGSIDETDSWARCPDVLLWVLAIGAHCSRQQDGEWFFVDCLWQTATLLDLHTWEDARDLLARYLFVDEIYQETLEVIWARKS